MKEKNVLSSVKIMESIQDYQSLKDRHQLQRCDVEATLNGCIRIFGIPWTVLTVSDRDDHDFDITVTNHTFTSMVPVKNFINSDGALDLPLMNRFAFKVLNAFDHVIHPVHQDQDNDTMFTDSCDITVISDELTKLTLPDIQNQEQFKEDTTMVKLIPVIKFKFSDACKYLDPFESNTTEAEDTTDESEESCDFNTLLPETDDTTEVEELFNTPRYDYKVKVEDSSGFAMEYVTIYNSQNEELGTTDNDGYVEFTTNTNTVTIKTSITRDGYFVNQTITAVSTGMLNIATVRATQPYYSRYGKLALGSLISMFNHDWIICHIEDGKYYLAARYITETTEYSDNDNDGTYKNSTLVDVLMSYQNSITQQFPRLAKYNLKEVTLSGVTSKVFIPSRDQLIYEFKFFKHRAARIGKRHSIFGDLLGNLETSYWTSTHTLLTHEDYAVNQKGRIISSDKKCTHGFRPFLCMTLDVPPVYTYDVTIKDFDGRPLSPYVSIYDSQRYKILGTPDINGHIKFNYPNDMVTIETDAPSNGGYYLNATLDIKLGLNAKLGKVNQFEVVANQPYYGNLALGSVISVCNHSWIICHVDGDKYYLASKICQDETQFGDTNVYDDSIVKNLAAQLEQKFLQLYSSINKYLVDVTVNGVTSKVFIPSSEQMNRGFDYFMDNNHRICYDESMKPTEYWLSTPAPDDSSTDPFYSQMIHADGTIGSISTHQTCRFRPFICIDLHQSHNDDTDKCDNSSSSNEDKKLDLTKPYTGNLELGGIINIFDRDWRVCHIEDGKYYLGAKEIKSEVEFGVTNVYKVALGYQDELLKQYPKEVEHLVDVTFNDVTSKVFIPSKEQMNGGFRYFNSDEKRICKYKERYYGYWTSSPNRNYIWTVTYNGSLSYNNPNGTNGFRPFVCFKP